MRYCSSCGAELQDYSSYCPKCGSPVNNNANYNAQRPYPNVYDSGSVGWAILGFILPMIGLILFIVWLDYKPRSAKMAGLGALACLIFWIIIIPVAFVIAMLVASSSSIVI